MMSGKRAIQNEDHSFTWHMNEYAEKTLPLIECPRGFLSKTTELDDSWMNKVVSANGKIGWLGSNSRPDAAAAHSIFVEKYKNKSPTLVKLCNGVVK